MRHKKKAYRLTISGKPVGDLMYRTAAQNKKARLRSCFKKIGIIRAV